MWKTATRLREEEYIQIICDECHDIIKHDKDVMTLIITGTGYSMYGGACESEWEYNLCRHCASNLKEHYDNMETN